jgi:endoglucanase
MRKHHLSSITWAVSNKDESAGIVKPHLSKLSGWAQDELTENGNFMRRLLRGE